MPGNRVAKKRKVQKVTKMAEPEREVIEIDDSSPSPDRTGTPLKPVFCLKNRHEIDKFEESEECFILDFDPYDDDLDIFKLSLSKGFDDASELRVVSEKGQVACRDYPHPRHSCAKYPFEKTTHDKHCKLCYCYVCDLSAPCPKWNGSSGHCHAFNNEAWDKEKEVRRRKVPKKTI
ncbi:hypothetical protein ACP275_06G014800 [Erythranthe tilingii]